MTEAVAKRYEDFEFGLADRQTERVRVYDFHEMTCDDAVLHMCKGNWEIRGLVECGHKIPRRGRLGRLADFFLGEKNEHGFVTIEDMSRFSVQGSDIGLQDYRIRK